MSDAIREFVLQIERSLSSRRLYAPGTPPFHETNQKLFDACRAAAAEAGFTLRVGAGDLYLGKTSLIHRDKREECFFFPLYRDGLRELTFQSDVSARDVEALLDAFEAEEKRSLGPSEDTVCFLWRRDLTTITYNAIDGIGDEEGEDNGTNDDFAAVVSDLADRIKNPAPPVEGQSYAFVMDADVRLAGEDLHYEATTTHRAFENNPSVYRLDPAEAQRLRAGLDERREGDLLERLCDILAAILGDASGIVPAERIDGVLTKLIAGFWQAQDLDALLGLLGRLDEVARRAPVPESRAAAAEVLCSFLAPERLQEIGERLRDGSLPLETASRLWQLGDVETWESVLELCARLPDGELHDAVLGILKGELASNPLILRSSLTSDDPVLIRTALKLMDRRLDAHYASELLALAAHPNEAIRLKGLAAAGRLGGARALETLWRAMQSDPSKSVRLLAFRLVASSKLPGLPERLRGLVLSPDFAERPLWEQEKYVRLLGAVAGDSVRATFERWIPAKRWFWSASDLQHAELALHGLAACGRGGSERLRELVQSGGKLGELAAKVAASSRREAHETAPPRAAAARRPGGRR